MNDLISRQAAIEDIRTMIPKDARFDIKWIEMWLMQLPSAQSNFDVTAKIDKAYDDGYEAGYFQGRHDWGDLDE